MLETTERLPGVAGQLQEAHVRVLRPEHQLAIAFRMRYQDFKLAPSIISYSESQTKRRWNEIQDFFLPFLGLPRHDDLLTGMWVVLHAGCCTAPSFALLENDSRFASQVG